MAGIAFEVQADLEKLQNLHELRIEFHMKKSPNPALLP